MHLPCASWPPPPVACSLATLSDHVLTKPLSVGHASGCTGPQSSCSLSMLVSTTPAANKRKHNTLTTTQIISFSDLLCLAQRLMPCHQ